MPRACAVIAEKKDVAIAAGVLFGRLVVEAPTALCLLAIVGLVAIFGRLRLNRWTERLHDKDDSGSDVVAYGNLTKNLYVLQIKGL